jgi:hypothetical protein
MFLDTEDPEHVWFLAGHRRPDRVPLAALGNATHEFREIELR